jgi:heme-degrading monooxygenase HmoA
VAPRTPRPSASSAGSPRIRVGGRGSGRRDDGDRTEFITYSLWEDRNAIAAFAGDDIEAAVYYPEDERYLIERDATVTHYEVADHVEPRQR